MRTAEPLVLGYLVRRYPELSQTFVRLEIEALRRRGHRVLVASLWRGDGADDVDDPDHVVLGERVERTEQVAALASAVARPSRAARALVAARSLPGEVGREAPLRPPTLARLARQWRREGVQHVHAHFAWEGAAAAMVVSRLLGVRWSVTVHANDMYADRRNLAAKLRDADRVITVCEYNRKRLAELEGVTGRIPVVVCGVEDAEPAADLGEDVIAVGRLVEKKGFDLLITAAAIAARRHPSLRVRIIGDGPARPALEALADGLGVAGMVEFAGARPHAETLDAIGRAAVLALPCRIAADDDRDSMPLVAKEAMMRAVPVVGTAVAAVPEMVDDEVGALVPAHDPAALAEAIVVLASDPDERRRRGAAGRQRALARFRLEDAVDALAAEFADLAGLRGRWPGPVRSVGTVGDDAS